LVTEAREINPDLRALAFLNVEPRTVPTAMPQDGRSDIGSGHFDEQPAKMGFESSNSVSRRAFHHENLWAKLVTGVPSENARCSHAGSVRLWPGHGRPRTDGTAENPVIREKLS
jgi:hypothetical protein